MKFTEWMRCLAAYCFVGYYKGKTAGNFLASEQLWTCKQTHQLSLRDLLVLVADHTNQTLLLNFFCIIIVLFFYKSKLHCSSPHTHLSFFMSFWVGRFYLTDKQRRMLKVFPKRDNCSTAKDPDSRWKGINSPWNNTGMTKKWLSCHIYMDMPIQCCF